MRGGDGGRGGTPPRDRDSLRKQDYKMRLLCCFSKGCLGLKGSAPGPKKDHKERKK